MAMPDAEQQISIENLPALERTRRYREAISATPQIGFPVEILDVRNGDELLSVTEDLDGITYVYQKDKAQQIVRLPTLTSETSTLIHDGAVLQVNGETGLPMVFFIGGRERVHLDPEKGKVLRSLTYTHLPEGQTGILPATQLSVYVVPGIENYPPYLASIHENIGAATVRQTEPISLGIKPSWFPAFRAMDGSGVTTIGNSQDYLYQPQDRFFTPLPFNSTRDVHAQFARFGTGKTVPILVLQQLPH